MTVEFLKYEGLAEIRGNKIQWSFLTYVSDKSGHKWVGLHSPFVCKDFLQDMFYSEFVTKKPYSIYGFNYKSNITNILRDKMLHIGIKLQTNSDKNGPFEKIEKYEDNLEEFLNRLVNLDVFGKISKFRTSSSDDGLHIIFKVDQKLFQNPVLISLFTFLVRIGFKYESGRDPIEFIEKVELVGNDAGYRSSAVKVIKHILEGNRFKISYKDFSNIDDVHDNSGIVACSNNMDKFFYKKGDIKKLGAEFIDLYVDNLKITF